MARVSKGYMGDFTNKLGPAVGRMWRGMNVLASYQPKVKNPRTDAQVANRKVFAALSRMAKSLSGGLNTSMNKKLSGTLLVPRTWFIKNNKSTVTIDGTGVYSYAYANMILAKGGCPEVTFGQANFDTAQTIKVPFADNAEQAGAKANDKVYLVVYCPDLGDSIISFGVERSREQANCVVPDDWNGLQVQVWGFTVSEGDSANYLPAGEPSNSAYVGTGEIQ